MAPERRAVAWVLLGIAFQVPGAWALEFLSVKPPGAVMYDAPSQSARRLFILSAGYPVEVVVSVEGWHKVRDASGGLAWVAVDRLSDERRVMANSSRVPVRSAPSDDATLLFEAEQGVHFKVLETLPGWLKVEHRDGAVGFLRSAQVWGQ